MSGSLVLLPFIALRKVVDRSALAIYRGRHYLLFFGAMVSTFAISEEYLFQVSHSEGMSMYPTIPDRYNSLFINKTFRNGRGIKVGDCVQIRSPLFRKQYSGKRVIGLPGDYILRSRNASPTPGGAPLPGITDWRQRLEAQRAAEEPGRDVLLPVAQAESPVQDDEWDEPEMIQVPEGHVWVEGDNLSWSRDSRFFGPVPLALVRGRSSWFAEGFFTFTSLNPGRGLRKVEEDEMKAVLGG